VPDQSVEALELIAANKPDGEICDTLARSGMAPAEAQYAVAAAKQQFEDLVRQSQARLTGDASPFSVAKQLAAEANLPDALAEQIVVKAHTRVTTIRDRENSVKLERPAKIVGAIIGIIVFVIVVVAVGAGTGIAEVIGLVAGAAVYFAVFLGMRRREAQKRKI
jgi:Flp pilus assembly protein TadB